MATFPSVDAMIMVLPVEDGPNSFDKSTRIVSIVPSTLISTFFMMKYVSFRLSSRNRWGRHIGAVPGYQNQHRILIVIRSSDQFGTRTEELAGPIVVDIQMQPSIPALALLLVESQFGEREGNQYALNRRHPDEYGPLYRSERFRHHANQVGESVSRAETR